MSVARRKLGQALLVGAAFGLAGCKIVPKGPSETAGPPPNLPEIPNLPVDTTRHRIALLVPLTGASAGVGESIANAANMAVLDTGNKTIRLTVYDTSAGAAPAAQRALADGSKLILGPLLADDVHNVVVTTRRARVPLISFANDTSVAGKGVYVLGFTPAQSIERVVRHASAQGKKRFALISPKSVYGERALAAFRFSVDAVGGTVVASESYDRNVAGVQTAAVRLGRAGPIDAILIADTGRVASDAVPILRRNGNPTAQILGTELWNNDPTISKSTALHGAWFASVSDGVYSQLSGKYRTRYGSAPFRLASLGYDSIMLVNKVSRDWRTGTSFPLSLFENRLFAGIDGPFRFSSNGIAERALEVQKVTAAGTQIIAAAPKTLGN